MNLEQTRQLRCGEYTVTRSCDTPAERADARNQLRRNGCRCVRFEVQSNGTMVVHGYLSTIAGAEPV